jgi:hypothetical protein
MMATEQHGFDPASYKGPPRDKVLVMMPCYDWKIDCECVGGLLQCVPFYERPLFFKGMSDVALARNELVHVFMEKTNFEWAVMIDSDTTFTIHDWCLLMEGEELVVTAEYARKVVGEKPVRFGLGFTRVHRSVFEKIKALSTEDGQERAQRFYHKGEIYVNYFPNGVTAEGRVVREDAGFFMLVSLCEVSARVETRTRLGHVGPMKFGYPDQVAGYSIVDPPEDVPTIPEAAHQASDQQADDNGELPGHDA